ncbi:MAG: sugar ABC transporter permease [Chloroflexota bacterium]|nr:sugar ABC transporter permease [Chloroflexia bacterium]MDQ3227412.1 sugar ABC transporter permease [Chloroflexota bacterium]
MTVEGAIEIKESRQIAGTPWWERNLAWLLVAPTVLMFVVFAVIPAFTTIAYAFSRVRMARGGITREFIGFENFARALQDPLVAQSVTTTVKWMLVVTALEVVLGLLLALLMSSGIRGRGLFTSLLIVPIIMPPVAVSVAWLFMYDYEFGIFNYLLNEVGLPSMRWLSEPAIAIYAMMAVDIWQATPFAFLLLYAALLSLPRDPYEAAAIDGAGRWYVFRTVTLPLLQPVLLVVILLRLIDAARIFDKIFVMTRGGPGSSAYTATLTIYIEGFTKFDFGYASALSFLFQLSLIAAATFYVKRVLADYAQPAE